jgi:hypothetical protein
MWAWALIIISFAAVRGFLREASRHSGLGMAPAMVILSCAYAVSVGLFFFLARR